MAGYVGRGQPVAAGNDSVENSDIVDGAVTDDKLNSTKLDSIESGATADQTKADIDALGINAARVNNKTVETSVPSGAVFTDTVYSKPASEPISYVSGLQTALDGKVDDSQVLTNVPAGALFTDTNTVYTHPASHAISEVSGLQTALDGKTTEAYVDGRITSVVGTAPAALDTLQELGDALGDDANFAGTMTSALATKAPQSTTYTKTETDAKIVELAPATDISGKLDKTGGSITGNVSVAGDATIGGSIYHNNFGNSLPLRSSPYQVWHFSVSNPTPNTMYTLGACNAWGTISGFIYVKNHYGSYSRGHGHLLMLYSNFVAGLTAGSFDGSFSPSGSYWGTGHRDLRFTTNGSTRYEFACALVVTEGSTLPSSGVNVSHDLFVPAQNGDFQLTRVI